MQKTVYNSSRLEYSNWKDMIKRCFNKNNKRYENYAKCGVSVHNDFVISFSAWLNEIGEKPTDGQAWSVGRIDNTDWYTYGNIRWELPNQQARNHSKQKNNTSGVTGVKKSTKVIAGVTYTAWVASWQDLNKKRHTKNFSIQKYGEEVSFELAKNFRDCKILELNEMGAGYADSHGAEKGKVV